MAQNFRESLQDSLTENLVVEEALPDVDGKYRFFRLAESALVDGVPASTVVFKSSKLLSDIGRGCSCGLAFW